MQADLAGTSATIRGTAAPALAGRSVLLFAVQLVPLFALSVWVYSSAIPVWGAWVMGGVNASYRAWSVPLEVHSTDVSGEIHARVLLSGGRSEPLVVDRTPETVFVSLILLPSLILATPIALRRRVMLLSIGLLLLYVVHVLSIAVLFHELWLFRVGQSWALSDWLLSWCLTSGQMSTVMIWALLTGGYWFPWALRAIRFRGQEKIERNAPCPCGSQRKYKQCCGRAPA
jgi:SEC-C motif-containing protein